MFDNRFARLPDAFYTRLAPTPLPEPYLVAASADAAARLGVDPARFTDAQFIAALTGNRALAGSEPLAAVYSGHQFGVYVPRLGVGRALFLGEVVGPAGERWEVQLKGGGKTPYSRMATAGPCCARRSANSLRPRLCTASASRRRGRWR